jgi:molybdopterin molybdotransferase
LGIARDEPDALRDALRAGMQHDVLVLSGGVSMGDYDLAPGLLAELGTEVLFDSVAMKPGRPMVFGLCGDTLVFGLPGNPVSVMVGTELFVAPTIKTMMGYGEVHPRRRRAKLAEALKNRLGRTAHVPGVLEDGEGGLMARPLRYHGSAHVHAMSMANALIVVPSDAARIEAGETVEVVELAF